MLMGLGAFALLAVVIILLFRKLSRVAHEAAEIKAREQVLVEQNKSHHRTSRIKAEFFQNMSHDFKTPLTIISTSITNVDDMLNFEAPNAPHIEEMRESLKSAQREVMRMSRMIDSALKIAIMDDSSQEKTPMNIAKVLRDGAEVYRTLFKQRGNAFTANIPQTLPKVFGNEDLMLHVFSNLFSNSNRHTQNGNIILTADEKEHKVVITLADNGTGIAPELLPKIFDRGVSHRSTGLGLGICKSVIEEIHRGKIYIKSRQGQGTQVTIDLPIYKEDSTP